MTKNPIVARAITKVASHPPTTIDRGSVKRPITRPLVEISIMTAITGAATTPLSTALQYSALIGSIGEKLSATPTSCHRDRRVERLGASWLTRQAVGQSKALAEGVGGRSGQHRHGQHSGADDADGKQREGERACDRA